MQGEILFESVMVECKAIRLIQKTPKGFPRGGSCPRRSGLMRAKLPQPPIYEQYPQGRPHPALRATFPRGGRLFFY